MFFEALKARSRKLRLADAIIPAKPEEAVGENGQTTAGAASFLTDLKIFILRFT